jgi:tRNA threonylcarbamoyladenosine biosynthesis protein TsaE
LVALEGALGAGKTVFVRGLAEGLGHDPEVVASPSFVLAVEHPGGRTALLHVDLYRLAAGAGVEDLGIDEALERGWVVAIEWGERLPAALRCKAWRVILGPAAEDGEETRALTILAPT